MRRSPSFGRRRRRLTLPVGRPSVKHRRPTEEELEAVKTLAGSSRTSFHGARDLGILTLMPRLGVRPMTLLAMRGEDFRFRRDMLLINIHEKGRTGTRPVEAPSDVVSHLLNYIDKFNQWAQVQGWECRIGVGVEGAFWRASSGRPLPLDNDSSEAVRSPGRRQARYRGDRRASRAAVEFCL